MEQQALSLHELNGLVKRSIRSCLPDTYWVQAELSDVRANYAGLGHNILREHSPSF